MKHEAARELAMRTLNSRRDLKVTWGDTDYARQDKY